MPEHAFPPTHLGGLSGASTGKRTGNVGLIDTIRGWARVPGRMELLEIAGARKRLGNLKRGLAAGHARRVALAERAG